MADDPILVTVEARFRGEGDPSAIGERIREAISLIVGRERLEEFRVRVLPLTPPTEITPEPFVD